MSFALVDLNLGTLLIGHHLGNAVLGSVCHCWSVSSGVICICTSVKVVAVCLKTCIAFAIFDALVSFSPCANFSVRIS